MMSSFFISVIVFRHDGIIETRQLTLRYMECCGGGRAVANEPVSIVSRLLNCGITDMSSARPVHSRLRLFPEQRWLTELFAVSFLFVRFQGKLDEQQRLCFALSLDPLRYTFDSDFFVIIKRCLLFCKMNTIMLHHYIILYIIYIFPHYHGPGKFWF